MIIIGINVGLTIEPLAQPTVGEVTKTVGAYAIRPYGPQPK